MTTYQVTGWCSVAYCTIFDVEAGSLSEALEKARLNSKDESGEPCDGAACDWNEFEIVSEGDENERLRHLEPELLAQIAAPELIEALLDGIRHAQDVVDAWEKGDLAATVRALEQWLSGARTALNTATINDPSQS